MHFFKMWKVNSSASRVCLFYLFPLFILDTLKTQWQLKNDMIQRGRPRQRGSDDIKAYERADFGWGKPGCREKTGMKREGLHLAVDEHSLGSHQGTSTGMWMAHENEKLEQNDLQHWEVSLASMRLYFSLNRLQLYQQNGPYFIFDKDLSYASNLFLSPWNSLHLLLGSFWVPNSKLNGWDLATYHSP